MRTPRTSGKRTAAAKTAAPADPLLEIFLEMLLAERNAARNTREAYRRDLVEFARFARRKGAELATADAQLIRASRPSSRCCWLSAMPRATRARPIGAI